MQGRSQAQRYAVAVTLVALACLALGSSLYALFSAQLIASMYRGESLEVLNELVRARQARSPRPLESYLLYRRIVFSRLLLGLVAYGIALAAILHRTTHATLRAFFTTAMPPLNLALFRVVFFATLLASGLPSQALWYSRLPAELQIAPVGFGWLLPALPIAEPWARIAAGVFVACCYTGLIGFCSRASALLTAVLGVYVLGIPQFYGKVNKVHPD